MEINKKINILLSELDYLFPNPLCELNYSQDYELLIAVVLSSQTTDKKVNLVTKELFNKYSNLESLKTAELDDLEKIIKIIGAYRRKAIFIKGIANELYNKYDGIVPNNRKLLELLPGVGRKTTNVVLSILYQEACIAVDTHVSRVSKRLGIVNEKESVIAIENKLMNLIDKKKWSRTHQQLVLFGRYYCKARKPKCSTCNLKYICKNFKFLIKSNV